MPVVIVSASEIHPLNKKEFLNQVIEVEKDAWPEELQASREKMQARLEIFPRGFFVAMVDGKVKGVSTAQITHYPSRVKTWDEIADSGFIKSTHNDSENALYVVSAGVATDTQGMGIGGKLLNAQKELAKKLDLSYLFLGARIPGYNKYCEINGDIAIEKYVNLKKENGEKLDPELRFYERQGLHLAEIKPHFEPDVESRDYGAIMVWEIMPLKA